MSASVGRLAGFARSDRTLWTGRLRRELFDVAARGEPAFSRYRSARRANRSVLPSVVILIESKALADFSVRDRRPEVFHGPGDRSAPCPCAEELGGRSIGGDLVVDGIENPESQPNLGDAETDNLSQIARVDVAQLQAFRLRDGGSALKPGKDRIRPAR